MNAKILTLDVGTTNLKCVIFDTDGRALATAVSSCAVSYPKNGWAEQPVEQVLSAARKVIQEAMLKFDVRSIAAIGITGAEGSLIPIDAAGNALHPNLIGADARAYKQVEEIQGHIATQEHYARSGNRINAHCALPKMLWLRQNQPEVYRQTRWFVHIKDVIYGFMTGRVGLTDYSDGSLTGGMLIGEGRWDEQLLRSLGLEITRMPQLRVSHDMEGRLTRNAARLLGLMGGIPVAVGAQDGVSAAHGAGLSVPGDTGCILGRKAWISIMTTEPATHTAMRAFSALDMDGRQYVVSGAAQCCGSALTWAADQLLLMKRASLQESHFSPLEEMAGESPVGARGLFFLPSLSGERTPWWDQNARGTLVGLTDWHRREDIARAVYEGVAQSIHLCVDALEEAGFPMKALALVGGGAQSGLWPQMLADVLDMPMQPCEMPGIGASLGAAMAAGVGVELFHSYAEAAQMVRYGPDVEPNPQRHVAYIPHYSIFRTIYRRLREVYREIGEYQEIKFGG